MFVKATDFRHILFNLKTTGIIKIESGASDYFMIMYFEKDKKKLAITPGIVEANIELFVVHGLMDVKVSSDRLMQA